MEQSSKTDQDENFPVASLILAKEIRHHVLYFYKLAREADDIADHGKLADEEKLHRLEALERDHDNPYFLDLIKAFKQDVTKLRYESWDELLDYCRYSANPVGRFLLEQHQVASKEACKASDNLCTALQILNHLQDCADDYRSLNRIYLPQDFLGKDKDYANYLMQPACDPDLRSVLDQCLAKTADILKKAAPLPKLIPDLRLRIQAKMTLYSAQRLMHKLETQDPLATRVELGKIDKLVIFFRGLSGR